MTVMNKEMVSKIALLHVKNNYDGGHGLESPGLGLGLEGPGLGLDLGLEGPGLGLEDSSLGLEN